MRRIPCFSNDNTALNEELHVYKDDSGNERAVLFGQQGDFNGLGRLVCLDRRCANYTVSSVEHPISGASLAPRDTRIGARNAAGDLFLATTNHHFFKCADPLASTSLRTASITRFVRAQVQLMLVVWQNLPLAILLLICQVCI